MALLSLHTGTTGGQTVMVSCMVRFSTLQFYSMPILASPPPASMASDEGKGFIGPSLHDWHATSLSRGRKKSSIKTILMGVLSGSLALIILFTILLIVMRNMRRRLPTPPLIISSLPLSGSSKKLDLFHVIFLLNQADHCFTGNNQNSLTRSIESSLIDLDAIRIATMDFSKENKLGEGGFGVVYKGVLEDGLEIAVKRLSVTSKQGLKQLRNKVDFMAKLQHKNLVKLLGCYLKDEEKLLVYEFLPNKSLDKYLSDYVRRQQLEWGTRYRIIEGIGRGLLHLHENPGFRIIHRDLKASNILLDINLEPKISGFGIAKLFKMDQTEE